MDQAMRSEVVGDALRAAEVDSPAADVGTAIATVAATDERLEGWGRVPLPGRELRSEQLERITANVPLTRGLARSYGDSSLPAPGDAAVAATPLA
ncbi:MAG: hypothetical protein IAG13_19325, partial [Deltaproteobacteria bacterium]|nr:hypothetical protein [Nannocystaceae bacterium]